MEVVRAFPLEGKGPTHSLTKFKEWIDGFDPELDQVVALLFLHREHETFRTAPTYPAPNTNTDTNP
ncbi:unnamed protein product [Discosporangium mesarthrocarpum]